MDFFGYGEQDFIPCEMGCGRAVDVHHLDGRGPGKDVIENLMGLCRAVHLKAGADPEYNEQLKIIHLQIIENHGR
jgi:hypothetical protein